MCALDDNLANPTSHQELSYKVKTNLFLCHSVAVSHVFKIETRLTPHQ